MDILTLQILSFLFLPFLSFMILIFGGNMLKDKSHFIALPLIGLMLVNSIALNVLYVLLKFSIFFS